MNSAAARPEADEILAELPERISDVIKPFARQSADHPALVQDDVACVYKRPSEIIIADALPNRRDQQNPQDRLTNAAGHRVIGQV